MDISWENWQRPDGSHRRQIRVSGDSDWGLFDKVARILKRNLKGRWKQKADGLDQRYWDFESGNGRITLHLEHYLGIIVYPTDGFVDDVDSNEILEAAFDVLQLSDRI